MAVSTIGPAYDFFLSFVIEKATPEEILAFKLPESIRERAIELLDKQDEDALSPEEAAELEQMQFVERLILALRARALEATQS